MLRHRMLGSLAEERAFVRASPNPVPPPRPGRTTLTWGIRDGSAGIVALVESHNGEDKLIPLTGAPSDSIEIDWIGPGMVFRFCLFKWADWQRRNERQPRPIATTTVTMQAGSPRELSLLRKAVVALRGTRAFVQASPNPVPSPGPGRTTLTWHTGDSSSTMLALVESVGGKPKFTPMTSTRFGSVDIDWIGPRAAYRFCLYEMEDWQRRDERPPRPIASTTVTMQSNDRREIIADVAVLAGALATVALLAWALGKLLADLLFGPRSG